jgi:hypothetical protein
VVATAHPAKFEDVVEPLVGGPVAPPPALAELLDRPRHFLEIGPEAETLKHWSPASGARARTSFSRRWHAFVPARPQRFSEAPAVQRA